ncbi:AraC family transcriptional regulator [Flavobacterium sp. TAB 87]|uniref:helix-turn-helix transcriptional regulator n=1 Tax=Flavobacterium sp. TAB 87 TaxID=1729581 RepID=UPI00076BC38F|nr:AraC family transcriptional regulator [Flavobacterium sp. TAB 87]KVV13757.1 putative response regulatory protein [Flavobacterium sp. TAB 87]
MEQLKHAINEDYLKKVDADKKSIYCHHDLMGELFVPTHQHLKAQLLYTEGDVVFVITDSKSYFLPARHFIWLPSGVAHSIHPKSGKVIMRNLYFPTEANEDVFYQIEGIYPVNDLLLQMMLFTNRWSGDLKKGTANFVIASGIKAILPQLCLRNLPLELPKAKDERLSKILKFIDNSIGEPILFTRVAEQFGYSERSLYRLFQNDLGMSFMQYYTIRRIIKAIELLLDRKLSIKEIAEKVGYSSVPTFSNTFYKILRQRPSDYLNQTGILEQSVD